MFDYQVTTQIAEAHRQDLLAEAKLHRLAKSVREQRRPRRSGVRLTLRRVTPLAAAR
jgi:hypothetical protein